MKTTTRCSSGMEASGTACWRFGEGSQMTQSLWSSGKKCRIGIWSSVLELFVRIGRTAEQQMANDMRRGFGELGAKEARNPGSPWHRDEHILTFSLTVYEVDIWRRKPKRRSNQDDGPPKSEVWITFMYVYVYLVCLILLSKVSYRWGRMWVKIPDGGDGILVTPTTDLR